jgi:hypothetical protein
VMEASPLMNPFMNVLFVSSMAFRSSLLTIVHSPRFLVLV